MSKKNFKDSPAAAFLRAGNVPAEAPVEATAEVQYDVPVDVTAEVPYEAPYSERRNYIRTQGRKGHKKPKITISIDSQALLDKIREQAELEGKSMTQFINDELSFCIDNRKGR